MAATTNTPGRPRMSPGAGSGSVVDAGAMVLSDLQRSGLSPEEMGVYPASEIELGAVGLRPHMYLDTPGVSTPGYVIPYYDMYGNAAPFYRIKLFKPLPRGARYLQPANTGSWLYYPRDYSALLRQAQIGKGRSVMNGHRPCIFITEGEKKAAKAVKDGFLCCALGGVYSWRTKILELPKDTPLYKKNDGTLVARIEGDEKNPATSDRRALLANGLPDLLNFLVKNDYNIVIVFDNDHPVNLEVQRAAAELAFEFRHRGVPMLRIRQLLLPGSDGKKVGLDDFLAAAGPDELEQLMSPVLEARTAFPRHPEMKAFINSRMQGQMTRNEAKEMSIVLLSDMDIDGIRMIDRQVNTPYFFDGRSKSLMRVNLVHNSGEPLHESRFGQYLYKQYDLAGTDWKVVSWLASAFTGEQPVDDVTPHSTLSLLPGNRLAYQLDDGYFAIVGPDGVLRIVENGSEGLLFRADQVDPLNHAKLAAAYREESEKIRKGHFDFDRLEWPQALSRFKFCRQTDHTVLSLLCYISPWLLRWNGTQLPVELMIGEPGSGKSSMYTLRQLVLTGRPALRNQPTDIRDWYSSITATDGIHVTDNVHFASKELRQRLSDEICRITTEPQPFVEMRKLYTTADNVRIPVHTTFALTAIQQPFINADILQRSQIFELQAIGTDFMTDWPYQMLNQYGGRERWVAHHLAVLSYFFTLADQGWNSSYKSQHRLANYEQLFRIMGRVLRVPGVDQLMSNMVHNAEEQISEYDWVLEALTTFCNERRPLMQDPKAYVTMDEIADWANMHEAYSENTIVTDSRRLPRYIKSHAFLVKNLTGLHKTERRVGNRDAYRIDPPGRAK